MRTELRNAVGALALCIALASGCGDPAAPRPSIAMSATVNGLPWHAGGPGAPPGSAFLIPHLDQALSVAAVRVVSSPYQYIREDISLSIAHVTGPGSYVLGSPWALGSPPGTASATYHVFETRISDSSFTNTYYYTSPTAAGTVVLNQFDPATRTVAGRFSFEAESGTGTRVVITSGSFSGHYNTD